MDNDLPTLFIDLPFEGYQQLLDKRAEALDLGILNTTDEDFVYTEVHLKDDPHLDAKIRLKGDWTDHLAGDKWSFRIHLRRMMGRSFVRRNFPYNRLRHAIIFTSGHFTRIF